MFPKLFTTAEHFVADACSAAESRRAVFELDAQIIELEGRLHALRSRRQDCVDAHTRAVEAISELSTEQLAKLRRWTGNDELTNRIE